MKYKPIGDKVLIRKDKIDSSSSYQTKSGITVISEATRHKGRLSLGVVEALGTKFLNKWNHKDTLNLLSVGDKVLYYHPAEIPIDNDLVLVRAIDIDAIICSDSEVSLR